MPAAAVIRGTQALSGVIGRKEYVGGLVSLALNNMAQPYYGARYCQTRVFFREIGIHRGVVKCVDTVKNTSGEGGFLEVN